MIGVELDPAGLLVPVHLVIALRADHLSHTEAGAKLDPLNRADGHHRVGQGRF